MPLKQASLGSGDEDIRAKDGRQTDKQAGGLLQAEDESLLFQLLMTAAVNEISLGG